MDSCRVTLRVGLRYICQSFRILPFRVKISQKKRGAALCSTDPAWRPAIELPDAVTDGHPNLAAFQLTAELPVSLELTFLAGLATTGERHTQRRLQMLFAGLSGLVRKHGVVCHDGCIYAMLRCTTAQETQSCVCSGFCSSCLGWETH